MEYNSDKIILDLCGGGCSALAPGFATAFFKANQ